MPNFGPGEIAIVLVIVLIVFGAGKLPEVLGQLGRGVKTFREEASGDNKPAATTPPDQPKHS
jgi:sec-independent protein translocase protein TatA